MILDLKMDTNKIKDIKQLEFLLATKSAFIKNIGISFASKEKAYRWINDTLVKFRYLLQRKKYKSLIRKYIILCTGYSRQQLDRLIRQYKLTGYIKTRYNTNNMGRFKPKYTKKDIELLAFLDKIHNYPSGPALKHIIYRQYKVYKRKEYANLYKISVSHIYNIRHSTWYKRLGGKYEKTKPNVLVQIGDRTKPDPQGKPGYIRVDTVHQGIRDNKRSIYHIHAIDEVTQYEAIVAVPEINRRYMIPALKALIQMFPFVIIDFHSDNGSEFINKKVLNLLDDANIRLTKSRPRRHNDNALIEMKNGAIIRKHIGYRYIDPKIIDGINLFYREYFVPYLNFSRPCAFAKEIMGKRGKIKKIYPHNMYMTPFEKLMSIPNVKKYLRDNITLKELKKQANAMDDNERALRMLKAKHEVFKIADIPDFHTLDILSYLKKKLNIHDSS